MFGIFDKKRSVKDTRLRKKLFGNDSDKCLNIYTNINKNGEKKIFFNMPKGRQGFVSQTIDEIRKLKKEVKNLKETVKKLSEPKRKKVVKKKATKKKR